MKSRDIGGFSGILVLFIVLIYFSFINCTQASETYRFVVSTSSSSPQHNPVFAEILVSDSAYQSGQVAMSDIESLRVTGGNYVPDANPILFSDLHGQFFDLAATLSSDKETITAFSAKYNTGIDIQDRPYWVFYQSQHVFPNSYVGDNTAEVHADKLVLITSFIPPNTGYSTSSEFSGQWRHYSPEPECAICAIINRYFVDCLPLCPWPWLILVTLIIVILIWRSARLNR